MKSKEFLLKLGAGAAVLTFPTCRLALGKELNGKRSIKEKFWAVCPCTFNAGCFSCQAFMLNPVHNELVELQN